MTVELVPVTEAEKPVLLNLMQFYCYDMSVLGEVEVTEHGQFVYRYIDHYFLEPDRDVLFVRHDGALSGFVMSREVSANEREVAEFFVMRRHRRGGVGAAVAAQLFGLHPGRWIVAFDDANGEATRFWPGVVGRAAVGPVERSHVGPPAHRVDRTILRFANG